MDFILPGAFLSFVATSLIIESTPGPNMAYLAVLSATYGRKAGFAAVLGIAAGLLTVGLAAALGVAALISSSTLAYQLLRWCGIFYLFWLAWDGWKEESESSPGKADGAVQRSKFFRRGFIVNLLNPKAAVFYMAILPGFIDTSSSAAPQALLLTVTYVLVATAMHSLIVVMAGTAQKLLENRLHRQTARRILSAALALIALWFAWETQEHR